MARWNRVKRGHNYPHLSISLDNRAVQIDADMSREARMKASAFLA